MSETLQEVLERQVDAWRRRPFLRRLYGEWHRQIVAELAPVDGPTVELGSGGGFFAETHPQVVSTDVEPTRWADRVVDAEALPYADGSVANLVLVDVFHHLARPARFLDEAHRVLRPGGRVVILDPYCSPVSTVAYRLFHAERTDLSADPLGDDPAVAAAPFESNQARATLVFFRHAEQLAPWSELQLVRRERLAVFAYALSGGFSGRAFVPPRLERVVIAIERLLRPLAPLLAFRCLVVLERR